MTACLATTESLYLLTHSILVNGPDGGHVCRQQLVLGQRGVACSGTDEASLPYGIVSHDDTLDGLYVGPLVIHTTHPACRQRQKVTCRQTYSRMFLAFCTRKSQPVYLQI